jgi:membrane-associated protease RseP (regulator of RpoE activity)
LGSFLGYLLYVLIVLAVIMVLVVVHELGHFLAARLAGVKATEFFVGFGPRIWSFRRGDTEYGIKWILIGGYVKILGMNPEEEISPEDFPHSYKGVSYARRFWIVIAGSLSHVILALLIAFFTIWIIGTPILTNTIGAVGNTIEESGEETPAYAAGLQPGDTIVAMNGESVDDWEEVRSNILDHPGEEVSIDILRDGQEMRLTAQLAELDDGNGYLGVSPQTEMMQYSFIQSIGETGSWWVEYSKAVFYGFYRIFNLSTLKQLIGVSEPTMERPLTVVGISRIAGQLADEGMYPFLMFLSFLLLFLAYINLLPLPPLDGGHLLVILVERFTGKEIDMRKLYPVAVAVLAFFAILFLLTLRLDILSPVNLP